MIFILLVVVVLVAWALHLMQQAMDHREFSLMLAGFLVSVAAAALVGVYFLMGHFVGYMDQMALRAELNEQYYEYTGFVFPDELVIEERLGDRSTLLSPPISIANSGS
ncbi:MULTISPECIES: hypothetical protein [unclassified Leptolyngbya]|uniref:hypothetical protein n=1 Tax=unclassified Leptolyngbya TaxID=2650499 RepID=UPI0018EF76FA|nr:MULTISPECIES: hypothetical protein [unclassified Leptolyngbya]